MTDINTVHVKEEDYTAAQRLRRTIGSELIAKTLGLQNSKELRQFTEGVDCQKCNVPYGEPCVTRAGRLARRPHMQRLTLVLAVIFALEKEIVIHEEEQIEDFL